MPESDPLRIVDELQGAPRRTGRFWFDFVAASAAIFISVVSLVIGVRGETIQKDLLAANSWPFLEINEVRSGTSILLEVQNQGVGPAKVVSFEAFYKNQPVNNVEDLLQQCCGLSKDEDLADALLHHNIQLGNVADNVIRPNESLTMIKLGRPAENTALFDGFDAEVHDVSFRACYCSILDKCWMSNMRTLKPEVVSACPIPQHPFEMIDMVRGLRRIGKAS